MRNFYQILEVSKNASIEEIKRSYRQKAKLCHPDVNANKRSNELFSSLHRAYKTLSDPVKRLRYDETLNRKAPEFPFHFYRKQNTPQPKKRKRENPYDIDDLKIYRSSSFIYNGLFVVGILFGLGMLSCAFLSMYIDEWPRYILPIASIPGVILIRDGFKGLKKGKPLIK